MPNLKHDHGLTGGFHSFYRCGMTAAILSVAMLGGFALFWGAWKLWRREGASRKLWLMAAAALVLFANVAIWTVPDDQGQSLVESADQPR